MQYVTGSCGVSATVDDVTLWAASYERLVLDLGTGDGRFVLHQAGKLPCTAVIGVDSCASNLRAASRRAVSNARFIVTDACVLPEELVVAADHINIAFPWGHLLRDVLDKDDALVSRLSRTMRPGATLEIVINADASRACEIELPEAQSRIITALSAASGTWPRVTMLDARGLKAWPSTWAKRLAYGRDPHAVAITARVSPEHMANFGGTCEAGCDLSSDAKSRRGNARGLN